MRNEAKVFDFNAEKKKRTAKKSQEAFQSYLTLLKTDELEAEVNFYLDNFPAQSELTTGFALRGQMILQELATRIDDKMVKASINTMANNLDTVIAKTC